MPKTLAFMLLALIAVCVTAAAQSGDKKITRAQLPPAVEKAVQQNSQDATIKGFSQEIEHRATFYEAEMTINGHSKDVLFDQQGHIIEIEEEVAFDSLPAAVKQGLQSKASDGKIGKVESLTKQGKLVAYEAKVTRNGQKSEIQVGPDGKPLDHEE
jgi:hypothetical protein